MSQLDDIQANQQQRKREVWKLCQEQAPSFAEAITELNEAFGRLELLELTIKGEHVWRMSDWQPSSLVCSLSQHGVGPSPRKDWKWLANVVPSKGHSLSQAGRR